jgi:predicted membrane channel-forming protein YqfA (hemolysin III family)
MPFLYLKINSFLENSYVFAAKAFSFDPSPGEIFAFFLLALIPVILLFIHSIVLVVNLKKRRASLRTFGYVVLAWHGLAALCWIFIIPWIGLIALALIAMQGLLFLRTF